MNNNLYQSKLATESHIVRATKYRDMLSARESIDETGRSYAYLCQRQKMGVLVHTNDTSFDPFIMSEDIFEEAYER